MKGSVLCKVDECFIIGQPQNYNTLKPLPYFFSVLCLPIVLVVKECESSMFKVCYNCGFITETLNS